MNLGAGISRAVPVRQGRDRLYSGEGAFCGVNTIAGNTAALLVGEIDEILGGMKAIVAGTQAFCWLDLERRIGGQMAGIYVELELQNHIGARSLPRRFQDVVVETGDMRHKGILVGGVGLYGMGAGGRGHSVEGGSTDCPI